MSRRSPWLRQLAFQVHLWTGLGIGLYVLVICLSGSAIVFRLEMNRTFCPGGCEPAFVTALAEFHDHLLGGRTGLLWNGAGAVVVALMCITGVILWWPRRTSWWRSVTIRRGVGGWRLVRELHSVLGFWLLLWMAMWVATGLYFAFPNAFSAVSDDFIAAAVRLHFGRAWGMPVKVLWAILGIVPCLLFITGALMWWHRSGELLCRIKKTREIAH